MKILSIDVGIKNLAYCLFEKPILSNHFKITKWDIADISEQEDILKCIFIEKNIVCNKPAKFKNDAQCFCLKHSKKQQLLIPTPQQKPAFIKKQSIKKLYEIADSKQVKYGNKIKKVDLINLINIDINSHYLESIESKKAKDVDLFNIGLNIKTKFNKLFENEDKIDYVIIENQIGPLAIRMKSVQAMLVQYFIMSNLNVEHIEFISASNKLKNCDLTEKSTYNDRKKLGITKCLGLITTNHTFNEHLSYFNQHKKKDDLADSFLQGIWFINNNMKV